MTATSDTHPDEPLAVARVIGRIRGDRAGPTLLCTAGVHGNEFAGVRALEKVLRALQARAHDMRGELIALCGNCTAFAAGLRYVDRDLNRAWTEDRIARIHQVGALGSDVEDREQIELLGAIEAAIADARGPVYALDLHTTSGFGGPFSVFGDTLANRDFASHIPVPMILGLEEQLDGTLLGFLSQRGLVALAYESGQHDEPGVIERAEAGIWIALNAAGLLPDARIPEAVRGRKLLQRQRGAIPRVLEMRYRHHIRPEDEFAMDPGYRSFQPVSRGQAIARDARGEVRIGEGGRILMPLYQKQGEDGFFVVREFDPFWLHVSHVLRTLRVDRIAHWLPGVQRSPDAPNAVIVDKNVARWFALQLFHLLGFRRIEDAGSRLVMRRRAYDQTRFVTRASAPGRIR